MYGHQQDMNALADQKRALSEFIVDGVPTTIPFHLKVLDHPEFIKGNVTTKFIEEHFSSHVKTSQ